MEDAHKELLSGDLSHAGVDLSWPEVRVLSMSANGLDFEIELRFSKGKRYCCAELGCFIADYDRRWWRRMREVLSRTTDRVPPALRMKIRGVVEAGALLAGHGMGGTFVESDGYTFEHGAVNEIDAK